MGSVVDYVPCHRCEQEAVSDFYYKTGEEYFLCNHCGYFKSVVIKDRSKKLNELTEDDWEVTECSEPFGAYRLKPIDAVGTECGTLVNEEQYLELKNAVKDKQDIDLCTVSRLVDGAIQIEVLKQHNNLTANEK